MLVLGLDPGIAKFGYGYVAHEGASLRPGPSGVITTEAQTPLSKRLAMLQDELVRLIDAHPPECAVIERLVPGPGRTLRGVAEARGVALALLGARGISVREESPSALKQLATRHGGATKLQVRKTVQRLLLLDTLPLADAADALALAALGGRGPGVGNSA